MVQFVNDYQPLILPDLSLRTERAKKVTSALLATIPGSVVEARGSYARGTTDQFSDIDLMWEMPDEFFADATGQLETVLRQIAPVERLRSLPAFQRSDRRRHYIGYFVDLPLFWRLDLELFAASLRRDYDYDRYNTAAHGRNWSLSDSALFNAMAAIKTIARLKSASNLGLLEGVDENICYDILQNNPQRVISQLCNAAIARDPDCQTFADRVCILAQAIL